MQGIKSLKSYHQDWDKLLIMTNVIKYHVIEPDTQIKPFA